MDQAPRRDLPTLDEPPPRDRRLIDLAGRQQGIVTRAQLLSAGIPLSSLRRWTESEWLRPIHRGVFAVGPIRSSRGAEMAAVLACGPAAVLSHTSAAFLWHLLDGQFSPRPVHVSIPPSGRRRHPGLVVHRAAHLVTREVTVREGLRVTTPARTLLDLATIVTSARLERALARALDLHLTQHREIERFLRAHSGRAGVVQLRALLADGAEPAVTDSDAEDLLLDLVRRARLPLPRTGVTVSGHRLDFYWERERLAVEVDGFEFHSSRASFERDRSRDADLVAAGLSVVRVTWRQLSREPEGVVAHLSRILGRA